MLKFFLTVFALSCIFSCIVGDIYMHGPRGSNNRLNEKSANRANGNRMFDSQNNNRGGYNVGDKTNQAAGNNANNQFQMKHFMSAQNVNKNPSSVEGRSVLPIEWTSQHGGGGNEDTDPNKLNTNYVIQFLAQPESGQGGAFDDKDRVRDGVNTNRQQYQKPNNGENENNWLGRRNKIDKNRGLQEPMEWYDKCNVRIRNKGLFTADQKVGNNAKNTRQNPGGNQNGYECPEERDYYPYWHPSPWKDIAIMAENASMCAYYQAESFNVKPKYECLEKWPGTNKHKHYSQHNNEADCVKNGGQWLDFMNYLEIVNGNEQQCKNLNNNANNKANKLKYVWGRPMRMNKEGDKGKKACLVALPPPECIVTPFSRDNHLGNGVDMEPLHYNWILPYFPSGIKQKVVLRIRYNISTDDYDPWNTDAKSNKNQQLGVMSPVQQNPAIDIGAYNIPMRLAINTAQYGRTFQDRSHMFYLEKRPATIKSERIMNVIVRGKRGNIVQTYPAVEYDFFPTNLKMTTRDLVHFQWTGSNTHNNGNPAGDGQAGDDGQGTGGTDRNNILGLGDRVDNFPLPMEDKRNFMQKSILKWAPYATSQALVNKFNTKEDISVALASSGYYQCVAKAKCGGQSVENKGQMNDLLNNAPASFGGLVLKIEKGTYHYVCTRNNNFSNRSQKGSIIVV